MTQIINLPLLLELELNFLYSIKEELAKERNKILEKIFVFLWRKKRLHEINKYLDDLDIKIYRIQKKLYGVEDDDLHS